MPSKTKRVPFNPAKQPLPKDVAKQLGLSPQRLQHGDFEAERVGIGHHRLREKAMLTHHSLLAERTNLKLRALADEGKEVESDDLKIQQTPSDRATAMWRHMLWNYMETRYEDLSGKIGSTNFERSSASSDLNRLPLTDQQFNRRKFYNWLKRQPGGRELTGFLNDVAAQCNPQAHSPEYRIMSKAEIGAWLLDMDNARECKAATDGALALACRILADSWVHFNMIERMQKKKVQP